MTALRWRHPGAAACQLMAFGYALGGHAAGIGMLLSPYLLANLAGTLLVAHSLVIAAFLFHECAHRSVFATPAANAHVGELLAWLTGACHSGFERIRVKHLRHHVDQADVLLFDYRSWLATHPAWRRWVEAGEGMGLPAVELLMHAAAVLLPFRDERLRHQRRRVLACVPSRVLYFGLIGVVHWPALLWHALAWVLFIQIMRFMDLFQHSYQLRFGLEVPPRNRSPAYEEAHTFSNPLSRRWPLLNLLVLNFCYHNVHHHRPVVPWYRLPALHRRTYPEGCPQEVDFLTQYRWFVRYRRERLMMPVTDEPAGPVHRGFVNPGANGVSFLTAV